MRSIMLPFVGLVLLGLILPERPACGQNRNMGLGSMSGFSNSGTFGNRSLGGSVSGGARSFGGGGIAEAAGDMPTDTGQVDLSSDRFVRGNRAPGQFVGADTAEMQRFLGAVQAGAGSNANRGGLQRLIGGAQNRGAAVNRQANTGGGRGATDVRTSLRVAFSYKRTTPDQISTAVAQRLQKSKRIRTLSAVQVHLEGGTATLRGVVATDHDRVLAERLTRLEAGIWRVKNELVVASAPIAPSPIAPRPVEPRPGAADRPPADTPKEPAAPPASPPEPPSLEPSLPPPPSLEAPGAN